MASTSVKSELAETPTAPTIEPIDLEERILDLCGSYPEGISDAELQMKIPPSIDAQQRATAINRLLGKSKIDLLKSGTMLLYKIKVSADAAKFVGASAEETMVYRVIEESKNKGEIQYICTADVCKMLVPTYLLIYKWMY